MTDEGAHYMSLERIYETFELLDDWEERYRVIIDLGNKLPPMADSEKSDENKITGCLSQVWMIAKKTDTDPPTYEIIADSDAHIVKGLIGLLLTVYSGKTKEEIQSINIEEIFTKLGLEKHLSPNRRNGFFSMVEKIKALAN
jgi:cysteine desulfuration protein SufE